MEQEEHWAIALAAVIVVFALHALIWRLFTLGKRHLPGLLGGHVGSVARRIDGWLGRWPRLQGFVRARLDTSRTTGLPLTIAVLAAFYVALLLGDVVEDLFEADEMLALDHAVQNVFHSVQSGWVVKIFVWVTGLGASQTLFAVSLAATGFLWALRRGYAVLPLWVVILGANATTWIGKYAIDRTRPEFVAGVTALSPSFPSGHATGSMALYGFIAFLIARELSKPRHRFELAFWSSVLILLVGASRIILSVHFLSDVVAGFLVGGFWILVGYALYEYRRQHNPADV